MRARAAPGARGGQSAQAVRSGLRSGRSRRAARCRTRRAAVARGRGAGGGALGRTRPRRRTRPSRRRAAGTPRGRPRPGARKCTSRARRARRRVGPRRRSTRRPRRRQPNRRRRSRPRGRKVTAAGPALVQPVHAPPLHLERGRPDGVEVGPARAGDQRVEPAHVLPRGVRIVVRDGRPHLVGPQHVPRAEQRPPPAHAEADAHQADRRPQEPDPLVPVVGGPGVALEPADDDRVEAAGSDGRRVPEDHGIPPRDQSRTSERKTDRMLAPASTHPVPAAATKGRTW